jgi:signal transduction histidine kinase
MIFGYFKRRCASKNLRSFVKTELISLPKYLYLDADRLTQVISNLSENAVKFTPEGGCVELLIQSSPIEQPENLPKELEAEASSSLSRSRLVLLSCAVTDTGIGIKEEDLKIIFDPFVQASPAISSKYGGSGLGLTIAKQLVVFSHLYFLFLFVYCD